VSSVTTSGGRKHDFAAFAHCGGAQQRHRSRAIVTRRGHGP
jgi:hypothetical protein